MAIHSSLANHLLIATPSVTDPMFERSVIYVCEHHIQGTVGLIINQPMRFPLGLVFDQLHIEPLSAEQKNKPLLFGGPNQPERGFVVHRQVGEWSSSLNLRDDVIVTTSNDIIRAMAADKGPKDVFVALGYSGWNQNQLEEEVMNNVWLVCSVNSSEILYEVPYEDRWEYAGRLLGVKMNQMSSQIGHA